MQVDTGSENSTIAHRYFLLNKPYGMLSQFKGHPGASMLCDLGIDFPEGTHPIGRLDGISEGLLILTTNKKVTRLLYLGDTVHPRTYLVRVYREVSPETVEKLRTGVTIRIRGNVDYLTTPCEVDLVHEPGYLFPAGYAIKENLPHSWLRMTLTEGKFRQIRKMLNAVRHPVQRLIRTSIEGLKLGDLPPGQVQEVEEEEFFAKLNIRY